MKIARAMLVTDGATLLCYGALSLFFVPVHSAAQVVQVGSPAAVAIKFADLG